MPKKILLADDSVTIQKVVSLILASDDYELISVGDGDSAIAKIDEIKPDLIMADVAMPGKNGYEVCDFVKKSPHLRHTPVLLLTGTFEPLNEEAAKKAQVDDSIVKPFESQEFIDKVNNLLSRTVQGVSVEPAISAPAPGEAFELGDFLGIQEEVKPSLPKEQEITLGSSLGFTEEGFLGEPSKQEPIKEPEKPIEIGIPEMPAKEEETFAAGLELGRGFEEEIKPEEAVKKEEPLELGVEEVEEIQPIEVVEPLEEVKEDVVPVIEPTIPPPTVVFPEREVSMPEIKMPEPAIFEERIEAKAKEVVAEEFVKFEAIPPISKEQLEEVVTKVSKKVIEEIAWDVIPDITERLIKQEIERIKEAILKAIK